jgi:hypothetical protein
MPTIIALALLLAFSATGLMAGGLAFKATGGLSALARTPPGTTPATTLPVGAAPATTSPTTLATRSITRPFTLSLSVAPNLVHPGLDLHLTIQASDSLAQTPVVGLACSLENPEDGGVPLLKMWPAPTVTGSTGQGTWTLTLPPTAPGIYEIGFTATGAHGYRYHGQVSVSVASAG